MGSRARAQAASQCAERVKGVDRSEGNPPRRRRGALYWRFFLNLALSCVDAAVFMISGATVLNLLHIGGLRSYSTHGGMDLTAYLLICSVAWMLSLHAAGVYHRHVMGDGYQFNTLLFKGGVICWVVLCALSFVFKLSLPLGALTLMAVCSWIATMMVRALIRVYITRSREKGEYAYATVLVGSPEGIGESLRFLSKRSQLNYRPVGVCPIRYNDATGLIEPDRNRDELERVVSATWGSQLPVIEYGSMLGEYAAELEAQTVMVCDVLRRDSDNFNTFSVQVESLGLELAVITSALDVGGHELQVRNIQGVTVLTIRLPQYTPFTKLCKRVFDIMFALLALICSSIVTIPVAIAIKLEDRGPVFYTQERVGLRGKPFRMIKFRSMVTNADELKRQLAEQTGQTDRFIFKMKDDPRITKVGRFIRRFSIDELPQFLNVLKGDMSVVGPRPPLPEEVCRYNQVYATRMFVKPGITGPWQVSGRSDLSAEDSERLDVNYVQNWSVLGDVVLILRTVGAVLAQKGAY